MARVIAVAGKGGSGKTTVAALLIRELRLRGEGPILAVDADPVANLGPFLGIRVEKTVGQVEQEFTARRENLPPGMTKSAYLELLLSGAIAEQPGLDLLAMGRPEGPGCYCSVHNLLQEFLDRLAGNYRYLVVDNEAGMEHLSRGTISRVDDLILVSDPSRRGLKSAGALHALVRDLGWKTRNLFLVVDRSRNGLPGEIQEELSRFSLPLLGVIPEDEEIARLDLGDRPVTEIPADSAAARATTLILDQLWKNRGG